MSAPILMAMSFHLLVRSSSPLRAQGGSQLQPPEQEFARELAQLGPWLLWWYCAIVSKTNPATLIAVGITPGTFNFRLTAAALVNVCHVRGNVWCSPIFEPLPRRPPAFVLQSFTCCGPATLTYSTISYQSQQPYIASVLSPVHPFPVYVPYATPLLFAGNNGNLAFYSSDSGVLQLTPH
jgi:hypothetical protein